MPLFYGDSSIKLQAGRFWCLHRRHTVKYSLCPSRGGSLKGIGVEFDIFNVQLPIRLCKPSIIPGIWRCYFRSFFCSFDTFDITNWTRRSTASWPIQTVFSNVRITMSASWLVTRWDSTRESRSILIYANTKKWSSQRVESTWNRHRAIRVELGHVGAQPRVSTPRGHSSSSEHRLPQTWGDRCYHSQYDVTIRVTLQTLWRIWAYLWEERGEGFLGAKESWLGASPELLLSIWSYWDCWYPPIESKTGTHPIVNVGSHRGFGMTSQTLDAFVEVTSQLNNVEF